MVGATYALPDWEQRDVLVPGGGRVAGAPGPVGQVEPGHQGDRGLPAECALADAQQRGELVPGGARIPGVTGEVGQIVAVDQHVGVFGAEDALGYGQQRGELVPGGGRVPRLPGPVGQAGAGGQGVGVFGAEDALGYGQQRGELVPGGGRVPRLPSRVGEFALCGQEARMLGTGRVAAHGVIGGDRMVGRRWLVSTQSPLDLLNEGPAPNHVVFHGQLGVLPAQPHQLGAPVLAQLPLPAVAAAPVSIDPVAQCALVDSEVPGHVRDRPAGLPDQPHRVLPEVPIELPARLSYRRTSL